MKLFVITLFSVFAFQVQAQTTKGTLLCSATSPKIVGFELIKVGAKDRSYTGAFDLIDMKIEGIYSSKTADLDLKISKMDDDGIITEELVFLKANLYTNNFLHFKTKSADQTIELYCYFIAK